MSSPAQAILRAFDAAQPQSDWRRPAVLIAALSGVPVDAALDLSVARRDAALLAWRQALFGQEWRAFAQCPDCGAMLEYELPVTPDMLCEPAEAIDVEVDGRIWRLRWPTSRDLARAAASADRERARQALLARMLEAPDRPDLPTARLLQALEAAHKAFWNLDLRCCACPKVWNIVFDAGEFLWREIRASARRILREVDIIARAYHWSEADILALSEPRRAAYLELL